MKVFMRERLNGYYGVLTFTIANTLASLPFIFLISVVRAMGGQYSVVGGIHSSCQHSCLGPRPQRVSRPATRSADDDISHTPTLPRGTLRTTCVPLPTHPPTPNPLACRPPALPHARSPRCACTGSPTCAAEGSMSFTSFSTSSWRWLPSNR